MSVREEVRRALCPETEVDKAFELLGRTVSADFSGSERADTAYNLGITDRCSLEMMTRLSHAGLVTSTTINHQVAYAITPRGREAYEQARSVKVSASSEQDDAIPPGEF